MADRTKQDAMVRWAVEQRVFIFYGQGGRFAGTQFDRWVEALEAHDDLACYVGGMGDWFTFDTQVRSSAVSLFKLKRLAIAIISDNSMHRVVGSAVRLLGVNAQLYSWTESRKPFEQLELSAAAVESLHRTLMRMRIEIDHAVTLRDATFEGS